MGCFSYPLDAPPYPPENRDMDARLPKIFFLVLVIYAIANLTYDYPGLPNIVASHFTLNGTANGWQTKQMLYAAFGGVTVLAAGLVFAIPALMGRTKSMNIPHREYWLAPERLGETQQFIAAWFGWFGCAIFALIYFAFEFAVDTSLHPTNPPAASRLLYLLAAFGAFDVVWIIRLLTRFSRVPGDAAAQR